MKGATILTLFWVSYSYGYQQRMWLNWQRLNQIRSMKSSRQDVTGMNPLLSFQPSCLMFILVSFLDPFYIILQNYMDLVRVFVIKICIFAAFMHHETQQFWPKHPSLDHLPYCRSAIATTTTLLFILLGVYRHQPHF